MTHICTKNMLVFDSVFRPGEKLWAVYSNSGKNLARGYTNSKDHAIRACRNFIRHNQNKVFD
jgi:polygalacturonase